MQRYIIRRVLQGIPVLFIVTIIVFLVLNLLPGDPVMARQGSQMSPDFAQLIEQLRKQMGLDRPIHERYVFWLTHALRGDLGVSYITQYPVADSIRQRLPATIELVLVSIIIALLISLPAGILAALNQNSWIDWVVTGLVTVGMAVPSFWLGIIFIIFFSVRLGWLPAIGYEPLLKDPAKNLTHLILPATTLALIIAAPIMRFLRSSLLEAIRQDYVTTARAKGLRESVVVGRHVLKNALLPLVTVVGLQFGNLLGGAVIIEWLFAWPGMGWLTVDAVFKRDYSVLQGTVTVAAILFVVINLLVDILYAVLDPRIRYGEPGT